MNKLELLKQLSLLRKNPLYEQIGQLSDDFCDRLVKYADTSDNNILESLSTRYANAPRDINEDPTSIEENYVQVFLNKDLTKEIEDVLEIKTSQLRIGIMKPQFGLDWHLDFDPVARLHCDLNSPSDFLFKIHNNIQRLDKEKGQVYKINVAHYHKVYNYSDTTRYALIGCVD